MSYETLVIVYFRPDRQAVVVAVLLHAKAIGATILPVPLGVLGDVVVTRGAPPVPADGQDPVDAELGQHDQVARVRLELLVLDPLLDLQRTRWRAGS